ncbi:ricin-type beta-trefoil lectin domain protein [Vibrio sp. PP-XX7]
MIQIQTTLDNGYTMTHGGNGGTARSLILNPDEYLQSTTICTGSYNGHSRIFYTRFTTNQNHSLASGSQTDTCTIFTAENQWSIVGFHGRSGEEIDKLGVIYAPVRSSMAPALFKPWKNLASGQCLEMRQATPSDKASVELEASVELGTCSGETSQQWSYDKRTGLIRSRHNSEYCLGSTGTFSTDTPLMISPCTGKSGQRFTLNEDGTIAFRMATKGLEANGKQLNTGELHRHNAQYWQ